MTSTRITAIALGIALLAPGTAVAQQDLRNPDNRPAVSTPMQDLRGPDAIDAGRPAPTAPAPVVAHPQSPAPADDTPWLSIAIVLGATFALVAAIATQARRRRTSRVTA